MPLGCWDSLLQSRKSLRKCQMGTALYNKVMRQLNNMLTERSVAKFKELGDVGKLYCSRLCYVFSEKDGSER